MSIFSGFPCDYRDYYAENDIQKYRNFKNTKIHCVIQNCIGLLGRCVSSTSPFFSYCCEPTKIQTKSMKMCEAHFIWSEEQ